MEVSKAKALAFYFHVYNTKEKSFIVHAHKFVLKRLNEHQPIKNFHSHQIFKINYNDISHQFGFVPH